MYSVLGEADAESRDLADSGSAQREDGSLYFPAPREGDFPVLAKPPHILLRRLDAACRSLEKSEVDGRSEVSGPSCLCARRLNSFEYSGVSRNDLRAGLPSFFHRPQWTWREAKLRVSKCMDE